MTTFEELQRIVQLQDTKANLENMIGTITEVIFGLASDTKQLGIYNGATWTWCVIEEAPSDGNIYARKNTAWTKINASGTYVVTNSIIDRTYNANATTLDELADIVATLILDLQSKSLIG
jgi:hypothetical protein